MAIPDVLAYLQSKGFDVKASGDQLQIGPSSMLTDDLRARIRAHKAEILAALQDESTQAAAEAAEERAAILEHDGGLSRAKSDEVAKVAGAFYSHLCDAGKRTGCCCAPAGRYCPDGERLRAAYYGRVS